MDPHTGAVIWRCVSYPRYDPNLVAVHNTVKKAGNVTLTFLNAVAGQAAARQRVPGAVHAGLERSRCITTSIALENGTIARQHVPERLSQFLPPQTTDPIQNFAGTSCAAATMAVVFYRSCNIPFAQTAITRHRRRRRWSSRHEEVGRRREAAVRPARCAGGQQVRRGLATSPTSIPLLAIGGFGAGRRPDGAAAHGDGCQPPIANGGVMMKPHVVDATLDHNGKRPGPRRRRSVWKTPITSDDVADTLTTT